MMVAATPLSPFAGVTKVVIRGVVNSNALTLKNFLSVDELDDNNDQRNHEENMDESVQGKRGDHSK